MGAQFQEWFCLDTGQASDEGECPVHPPGFLPGGRGELRRNGLQRVFTVTFLEEILQCALDLGVIEGNRPGILPRLQRHIHQLGQRAAYDLIVDRRAIELRIETRAYLQAKLRP